MTREASVAAWRRYVNRLIAAEASRVTRYFDQVLQWRALENDSGLLLESLDCPEKSRIDGDDLPDLSKETARRTAILLNGVFNHQLDIQGLLAGLRPRLGRTTRIVAVLYNPYFAWLYRLANRLGLRRGAEPTTFITRTDLTNLARLAGYEVTRVRPAVYFPWPLVGLGSIINKVMPAVPLLRWSGLVAIAILRPVVPEPEGRPSLSVIIPVRNERENIRPALRRIPALTDRLEVIFVEGHSTDGTWEELQRVVRDYTGPLRVKALLQPGSGKKDAVWLGIAHAENDLVAILDADLTMPPELLPRFYDAYRAGLADLVNGSRLVYPVEGGAMPFLNRLANVFFAKALSFVLETRVGDALCGTKLFPRHDHERFRRWARDAGDLDPFGDFELLFPAALLGLGIIDVPIPYRQRTYGASNIRRFRDGLRLLEMIVLGALGSRLGPWERPSVHPTTAPTSDAAGQCCGASSSTCAASPASSDMSSYQHYRDVWNAKPVLRRVYRDYFDRIASQLLPGHTLEIGGGSGNFKQTRPDTVSMDIAALPWLDIAADAQWLPFREGVFANVVAIDLLHHLERPVMFFRECERIVEPRGRILLIEPAVTWLSWPIYALFHPEPLDLKADPLEDGELTPGRSPFSANQACATLILGRHRRRFESLFPSLAITRVDWISLVVYPLSGGFRSWSLLPARAVDRLLRVESRVEPYLGRLMAFRVLIQLDRSA